MLVKDPAGRYQTGRELLKDIARLREALSGQTAAVGTMAPSVEMMPVSQPTVTEGALPASAAPVTAVMQQPSRRWGWRGLVFVVSVLLACAAGAGLGWYRHRLAFPLHAAVVPAVEEDSSETRLEAKEQALRTLLEQDLSARPGNPSDTRKGIEHGMDLGLYYLEHHRLDDARVLFGRLEMRPPPPYQLLGHLGQGIVLALQNEPQKSNKHFVKTRFEPRGKQPVRWLENLVRMDPKWRYWISKAIHYNLQNGLDREDVPFWFRQFEPR
jgi:hypothetical protein